MNASVILDQLLEDLESRLPALVAQFPDQTEDSIRLLGTYDPTDGKYITWILTRLRKEGGGMTPEAGEDLRRNLERFERVKRLPGFTGPRDINQYGTFEDFHRQMAEAGTLMSKGEQEKSYRKLATFSDYTLTQIMTEAAAKKFAQNTSLCFVGDYYARLYVVEQPPLYGVFKDKQPVAALHPRSNQYRDMRNGNLTGDLLRVVLKLVRRAHQPLLDAWYQSKIEDAKANVERRRRERRREKRRAAVQPNRFVNGVAPLGQYEGFQMLAMQPTTGRVLALLPETRRAGQPVLTLTDAEGNLVAMVDPIEGNALNAQGLQLDLPLARIAHGAYIEYIRDMAPAWLRSIADQPRTYQRVFQDIIENIRHKFMDERTHGYTDPRTGEYQEPVSQGQAVLRWQAFKPRMQRALKTGLPRLMLPSIGMARVLGYQGDDEDLLGESIKPTTLVHELLETKPTNSRGLPPPVEREVMEIRDLLQQSVNMLRGLTLRSTLDERDVAVENLGGCAERLDNLLLNYAWQDFPALDWVIAALEGARNDLLDLLNGDDWAKPEDAEVVQRIADVLTDLLK